MSSTHRLIGVGVIWFVFTLAAVFTVDHNLLESELKLQLTMIFAVISLMATLLVCRDWLPQRPLHS